MKEIVKKNKTKNYISPKKLFCNWTDKKKYLNHYRMLIFSDRHGMVVDKVHEINSFKQSKWLKNYMNFNTQKRNKAKNSFEKDFFNLINYGFFCKMVQNIRIQLKIEFFKNCESDKFIKQQSKSTFNGIHKS